VLIGFAVLVVAGVILGFIFAAAINTGSPPPLSEPTPPPTTASVAPPLPATTAPVSSPPSPKVIPLPQGVSTQVPFPDGTVTNGFTAGNLNYIFEAPVYSVTVHTAEVNKHWGFTYTYQCVPEVDDSWRQAYPYRGSFSIQFGGYYLLRGSAYNGSGIITVQSSDGPAVHRLVISGPCSYELDYFYYPN
jgi:hypothetical protein